MNTPYFFAPAARAFLACIALHTLGTALQPLSADAASAEQQAESAIMPFLDVLASPPSGAARSVQMRGRLESLNNQSFPQNQPSFDFALQPPGALRLSFPSGENQITACRDGQKAWAAPASLLKPILERLNVSKQKKEFPPMEIPFSGKQLGLLPVLLEIQDKGPAPLEGVNCRVLDVRMQPEIAQLMPAEAKGWALRLWLNPEGRPARAGIRGPSSSAVVRIDSLHFSPKLPAQTWAPPADAVALTPGQFEALAGELLQNVRQ